MSDGKDYEMFVQKLQQALINSEEFMAQKNITIERNKKIKDRNKIEREFDLYWEYELAGLTYKTIIECKDYTSKVSIEKIDALLGKLSDLPDLIPVFATKTGYQRGAEIKARNHKIELLIVREQKDQDWEDRNGNPLIKEITMNIHVIKPAEILNFKPFIDAAWLAKNPHININKHHFSSQLYIDVFIEDILQKNTYSMQELLTRLVDNANNYEPQKHSELFENAYLIFNGDRLKLAKYEIEYKVFPPTLQTIKVDFAKELIGVIEYLHKGSSTAFFKDRVIQNWK